MTLPGDPHEVAGLPELDDEVVERLLDGGLRSGEVPAGYEEAASLLRLAAGAATTDELTGGPVPIADASVIHLEHRRRLGVPARAVVVGVVAAAVLGSAAAAATGWIPIPGRADPTTTLPPGSSSGTGPASSGVTDRDRRGSGGEGTTTTGTVPVETLVPTGAEGPPVPTPNGAGNGQGANAGGNPAPGANGAGNGQGANAGGNPSRSAPPTGTAPAAGP